MLQTYHNCVCVCVSMYLLFSKPVAMVTNSLKSLCWLIGHLLRREGPQRRRGGGQRGGEGTEERGDKEDAGKRSNKEEGERLKTELHGSFRRLLMSQMGPLAKWLTFYIYVQPSDDFTGQVFNIFGLFFRHLFGQTQQVPNFKGLGWPEVPGFDAGNVPNFKCAVKTHSRVK